MAVQVGHGAQRHVVEALHALVDDLRAEFERQLRFVNGGRLRALHGLVLGQRRAPLGRRLQEKLEALEIGKITMSDRQIPTLPHIFIIKLLHFHY